MGWGSSIPQWYLWFCRLFPKPIYNPFDFFSLGILVMLETKNDLCAFMYVVFLLTGMKSSASSQRQVWGVLSSCTRSAVTFRGLVTLRKETQYLNWRLSKFLKSYSCSASAKKAQTACSVLYLTSILALCGLPSGYREHL